MHNRKTRRQQLVTWGQWGVSTQHPPNDRPDGCTLSVYRLVKLANNRTVFMHGTGYGKWFPDSDAASEWARVHGYLQPYYRRWDFVSLTHRWSYLGRLGQGPWPHLKKQHDEFIRQQEAWRERLRKHLVDTELLKDNGCEPIRTQKKVRK